MDNIPVPIKLAAEAGRDELLVDAWLAVSVERVAPPDATIVDTVVDELKKRWVLKCLPVCCVFIMMHNHPSSSASPPSFTHPFPLHACISHSPYPLLTQKAVQVHQQRHPHGAS